LARASGVSSVSGAVPPVFDRDEAALWPCWIEADADVNHLHLALSLFANFEALNRRIPTPPQCQINPLQHDVVDFEALLERDLA
jgi:hypothetical protein